MNSKSKIDTVFSEAATELRRLQSIKYPLGRWCQTCTAFSEAITRARKARVEDIRTLPFYWIGLDSLRHDPKEIPPEEAIESLDDSGDIYSNDEFVSMVGYFSSVMDALEAWAEDQDMRHGGRWIGRTDDRPWRRENIEECDGIDLPPYYGWVLVTINKIRVRFQPPMEPYATSFNTNPFFEQLFAYLPSRQLWCFNPRIVNALLEHVEEPKPESPLVGKYLAWGAPSVEAIPQCYLKAKDDQVAKELHERIHNVRAKDRYDLFRQLGDIVCQYKGERVKTLQDLVDELPHGDMYQGRSPLCAIEDRLTKIENGIASRRLDADGVKWAPLIAAALKLPRYEMCFFDWASCFEDEGPSEPGLIYTLYDGSQQEVHYDVRPTKWHGPMDMIEYRIEELIGVCKNLADNSQMKSILDDWLEVEADWNSCKDTDTAYHSLGETKPFSESFCRAVLKTAGLLPILAKAENRKAKELEKLDTSRIDPNARVDKARRETEREPLRVIVDGFSPEGRKQAVEIVNSKPPEMKLMCRENLARLFGVHVNTIDNWLKAKSKAQEGFHEALQANDWDAMQLCAVSYRTKRNKGDVSNMKDLVRNISEELMAKLGAQMPDGRHGVPS